MTTPLSDLHPTDRTALYLRPLCGAVALARPAARIGGAWAGFDQIEVVARDGCHSVTGRGSLDDLAAWAAGLGQDHRARIHGLLARLTDQRPPFAGICFDEPRIMGVLNVTPDSFSDGGAYARVEPAVDRGLRLVDEGACIIDVGGESVRPGARRVGVQEQIRRTVPVIERLRSHTSTLISIDTTKSAVARAALAAGADLINYGRKPSLAEEFEALETDDDIERELAELKARTSGSGAKAQD